MLYCTGDNLSWMIKFNIFARTQPKNQHTWEKNSTSTLATLATFSFSDEISFLCFDVSSCNSSRLEPKKLAFIPMQTNNFYKIFFLASSNPLTHLYISNVLKLFDNSPLKLLAVGGRLMFKQTICQTKHFGSNACHGIHKYEIIRNVRA